MKRNTTQTIGIFWQFILQYRWSFLVIFLSVIAAVVFGMIVPIYYKKFFDIITSGQEISTIYPSLFNILIAILIVECFEWVFWRLNGFLCATKQSRVMADISNHCFEYLHLHSYAFFTNNFAGGLVKKITRLVKSFEEFTDKIIFELIPIILRGVIILVVLFYLHPLLGFTMLGWTALYLVTNYFLSIYKLKFDIARSKADTKVTASLADSISNSITVKLFSAFKYERNRFADDTEDWYLKNRKSWIIHNYIDAFQAVLMIAIEFLIMFVAIKLWSKNLLTVGDFVMIQVYLFDFFNNLWNFGRMIRDMYESLASAQEMTEILNTPHQIADQPKAKKLKVKNGEIEFKDITFAYEENDAVLKNLDLKIKPGEKIALIGPSGGGKSTIVKLLLRFFDLKEGQIRIDDQNISTITQESLRKEVSLVPQDPVLFHRTLMENIRYGNLSASDEAVFAAAKTAHCHEFISKLPKGYETFVGERGVKLSGGERQRVAIARAILSNAKILVLDEATSNLDSESEVLIQEALRELMKNRTSIIIAHRLSTIMQADKILVIKDGNIAEQGTHGDLINKKGGLYKKLWSLQVNGYLKDDASSKI